MKKTIIFAIESLDWKIINRLVDAGKMPFIESLFESGSSSNVRAQHPMIASAMWETIITGKMAYEHGKTALFNTDKTSTRKLRLRSTKKYVKNIFEIAEDNGLSSTLIGWPVSHVSQLKSGVQIPGYFIKNKLLKKTSSFYEWPVTTIVQFGLSPDLSGQIAKLRVHPNELSTSILGQFTGMDTMQLSDEQAYIMKSIFSNLLSSYAISSYLIEQTNTPIISIYSDFIDKIQYKFDQGRTFLSVAHRDEVIDQCYTLLDQVLRSLCSMSDFGNTIVLSECGLSHRKIRLSKTTTVTSKLNSSDIINGVAIFSGEGVPEDVGLSTSFGYEIYNRLLKIINLESHSGSQIKSTNSEFLEDLKASLEDPSDNNIRVNQINSTYWCALNLLEDQKYDDAQVILEKVLIIDKNNESIKRLLQYIYQKKNIAITPQLELNDKITSQVNSLIIKAKTALKSNQREKCVEYLIQAEVKADNLPKLLHTIFDLYWALNDLNAADRVMTKLIELDSEDHLAWNKKGRIERKNGAYDQAIESLNNSILIRNHQPQVFYQLAIIAIGQEKAEDARRFLDHAIFLNPSNHTFRLSALTYTDILGYSDSERTEHKKVFDDGIVGSVELICSFDTGMIIESPELCEEDNPKKIWSFALEQFKKTVKYDKIKLNKNQLHYFILPKHLSQLPPQLRYNIHYVEPEVEAYIHRLKKGNVDKVQKDNILEHRQKRHAQIMSFFDNTMSKMPHITIKYYREQELSDLLLKIV